MNTTTQTASTKCQYSEKTSARSLCSGFTFPQKRENHGQSDHEQAHRDVKGMQADERVVGGAKEIRADGQAFVVNQVMPLTARADQKNRAERQ